MSKEELQRLLEDYLEEKTKPSTKILTTLDFNVNDLCDVLNELHERYVFVYLSNDLVFIVSSSNNVVEVDLAKYEVLFKKFDDVKDIFRSYY